MRLVFLLLLLLARPCFAQLTGRVEIAFSSIPANRVALLFQATTNSYSKSDLVLLSSYELQAETNNGTIRAYGSFDFVLNDKATNFWSNITNYSFPSGITGVVHYHLCPIREHPQFVPWTPCERHILGSDYLTKFIP